MKGCKALTLCVWSFSVLRPGFNQNPPPKLFNFEREGTCENLEERCRNYPYHVPFTRQISQVLTFSPTQRQTQPQVGSIMCFLNNHAFRENLVKRKYDKNFHSSRFAINLPTLMNTVKPVLSDHTNIHMFGFSDRQLLIAE